MVSIARRALRSLSARRQRQRLGQLSRRLEGCPDYAFTADYVSAHLEVWSRWLKQLSGRPDLRVLEIGSFEGRSAIWFLTELLTHPDSRLVCLDPFVMPGQELRFDHNLDLARATHRITKLKGFSGSVLPTLEAESFDLVYVDGSHRAADVLLDAVLAWRLVKPDGLMLFDDYWWRMDKPLHERPKLAIDLFLELFAGRHQLLLKEYQVLVRKTEPAPPAA